MATQTKTFAESASSSQTHTITIPKLKSVTSVSVNTGNVSHSVNGDNITFNLSNGAARTVQTGGSYSPSDSKPYSSNMGFTRYHYKKWNGSSWEDSYSTGGAGFSYYYDDGTYKGNLDRQEPFPLHGALTHFSAPSNPTLNQEYLAWSRPETGTYSGTITRPASDTRTYATYYQYTITINYIDNAVPTLSLTKPATNLALSEGNAFPVEGSASDTDNGNVVTIKYKINNGPVKALNSGVSNGSTPISFDKSLTYSNKRLWEGATDVVGADLAENTNHTLTVWTEDDQGGVSSQITRTFSVVWNRPPTISGVDKNLGTISTIPSVDYSSADPEGSTITFTEFINSQQIRSYQKRANLLGIDGGCEDTSKFTYTGGTATVDSSRKSQGNSSIKLTKTETYSEISCKPLVRPAVGDYFIAIAEFYQENVGTGVTISGATSGVGRAVKNVTPASSGFPATTTGQFIPLITAFAITTVTTPDASYFTNRVQHNGTVGHVFNIDKFRVYKITQAEYDALGTNVDLATARATAAKYPYAQTPHESSLTIPESDWLMLALDVPHQLKVRATDDLGLYSERIYTFTRTETEIKYELDFNVFETMAHFYCDAKPSRILVTLDAVIPSGASIEKVEVCNNAFDAEPAWEDATLQTKGGRGYVFTNSTKTADSWGINIRVTIDKGTATERVILNGFGGAFD